MTDESYSFSTARNRLEEIVTQVRKKDTSLEKSLDLLEEGVRLANSCTELIDRSDWGTAVPATPADAGAEDAEATTGDASETIVVDDVATIEDVVIQDEHGEFVAEVIEITEQGPTRDDFDDADDAWAVESFVEDGSESDESSSDEG
jgi:exodeoxyribonuclease VII small subunit